MKKIDTLWQRAVTRGFPGWLMGLGVAVVWLAAGCGGEVRARNADLSFWVRNLSESPLAEEPGLPDANPEIVTVGDEVHVMWFARHPVEGHKVCYRRSTDRGRTWDPVYVFYRHDTTINSPVVLSEERHLAVLDGRVHIVFGAYGLGSSWFGQLVYLRSIDNGVSFQAPRILWASGGVGQPSEPWHAYNTRVAAANGRLAICYRRQPNWYGRLSAQVLVSTDGGDSFVDHSAAASDEGAWTVQDFAMNDDTMALLYRPDSGLQLYAAVSRDNGATFERQVVSVPSGSGSHVVYNSHDYHNTPSIWCGEGRVHVIWKARDATDQLAIFHRRSLDGGRTWEAAQNMTEGTIVPSGQITSQDTITGAGNRIWVLIHTEAAKLYLRSSVDGGASFGPVVEVTDPVGSSIAGDAWWPMMRYVTTGSPGGYALDIVVNGLKRFRSLDGGVTFAAGALGPVWSVRSSALSQFAVDGDGTVHMVAEAGWTWYSTGVFGDKDIVYGRWDGRPAESGGGVQAVQLVTRRNAGDGSGDERFDGILVPDDGGLVSRSAFTVECWVKMSLSATNVSNYFLEKQGRGAGGAWETLLIGNWRDGNADARLTTETAGYVIVGGPPITDGSWHHVATTYDSAVAGTNFRLYVDGVEVASTAATGLLAAGRGPLLLGAEPDERSEGTVMLDDVRVWDRVLTAAEIADGKDRVLTGLEPGLRAWYPLEGSPRDASGNEHHGTQLYRETYGPGVTGSPVLTGPAIVSATILNARVGQPVNYRIASDAAATSFAASGLPAPLQCDPVSGVISGVPSASGVFAVGLEARGPSGVAQLTLTLQIDGGPSVVFDNGNILAVSNGPTQPTLVTLAATTHITRVVNYHYFNGGELPGTIGLRHENGTLYGPWQTNGLVGQGGVANASWEAWPMVDLPAGTYTVVDSSPGTWSWNNASGGRGFTRVEARAEGPSSAELFAAWAAHTGLTGAAAAETADPDGDGQANWIEQALGTHPRRAESPAGRFVIEVAAGRPVIRYRLSAGALGVPGSDISVNGTRVTLEVSAAMAAAAWKAAPELLDLTAAQRTANDDGTETITVPFRADRLNQGPWFVRERFTRLNPP